MTLSLCSGPGLSPFGLIRTGYAFGCELWAVSTKTRMDISSGSHTNGFCLLQAPSEEFGRWRILQLSMLLENCWMLMCALAPNFGTLVVGRVLGGFSLAGGSVTLGMVADLYEPEVQGYAVAWVVLSSVGGTTVGVSAAITFTRVLTAELTRSSDVYSPLLEASKANF